MEARWPFLRLPVEDVSGTVTLQRDTDVTLGIYTDSARTVPATVYAAATGATTKVNPVTQNVGGNNAFEGYLTAGQPYYWQIGTGVSATTGQFFAATDTYPSGLQIGDGSASPALTITPTTIATTSIIDLKKDGVRIARWLRNGSFQAGAADRMPDAATLGYSQVDDASEQNYNNVGVFPTFLIDAVGKVVGATSFTISDNSQPGTLTSRRTGRNSADTVTQGVNADNNLAQWIVQGDRQAGIDGEPSFLGNAGRIYWLATAAFASGPNNQPTRMFVQTQRPLANEALDEINGTDRLAVGPHGELWIFPLSDAIGTNYTGTRAIANMLTLVNDAGTLKTYTTAGTVRTIVTNAAAGDYTITNPVAARRTLDATSGTAAEVREVLATLLTDLGL